MPRGPTTRRSGPTGLKPHVVSRFAVEFLGAEAPGAVALSAADEDPRGHNGRLDLRACMRQWFQGTCRAVGAPRTSTRDRHTDTRPMELPVQSSDAGTAG